MYSLKNNLIPGLRCVVMPDRKKDSQGGRFFFGLIKDVYGDIITIEVTESKWHDFKKHDQLFFPRHQVWAENSKIEQLSLF